MAKPRRPRPRIPGGFRDQTAADVEARRSMLDTLRGIYELHGYEPLETPAIEYVEALGKFLPEAADQPDAGIFSFEADYDDWVALRYDLTAPLARYYAANHQSLPRPFRRYQAGPVWRVEKWGPGRFREFTQCDFDTVGTKSVAADSEVCMVMSQALEALGIPTGDYRVQVNNRKVLNGLLEMAGLDPTSDTQVGTVLRAMDKFDKFGIPGVTLLLGAGRKDPSGDFTKGAGLDTAQIDRIVGFLQGGLRAGGAADRGTVLEAMGAAVAGSAVGEEGVAELVEIHELLDAAGFGSDRIGFEPSIVRGLEYYTGPVFEAELTFQVPDRKGRMRNYGSVASGGRYDGLVERFIGQKVPATGGSIGVDRLLAALQAKGRVSREWVGPVVVTVMSKRRKPLYQKMVAQLRAAGIRAEMYLGNKSLGGQMKYADRRNSPLAIIAGGDEFDRGIVQIKDLKLGKELSKDIADRAQWVTDRPAQWEVPADGLVAAVQDALKA
jgi:histidyl-tRNA synthetase